MEKWKSRRCSPSSSKNESEKRCPICLNDIIGEGYAILSKCQHAYCITCIVRWSNYKRSCPLCNSSFDSYFYSSPSFLSPPPPPPPSYSPPLPVSRVLRRTRKEINASNRRSRPVPRLRSFGQPRLVPPDVITERALQWRSSIYERGLRAIPFKEKNLNLRRMTSSRDREEVLHRIEPWIRRELQAVLQDPDPTVIVHVATSLYLLSMESKTKVDSLCLESDDNSLAPLRPFLGEWTNIFWHELRCFAESCFTMNTYDEVVEYRKSEEP